MTYHFTVEHLPAGRTRFVFGGHQADSEHALARRMVEADMPDAPVTGGRPGCVDWTVGSLHALAAATLSEGERGFSRGVYTPHPSAADRGMHPALDRAVCALRERRKMAFEARGGRVGAAEGEKPLAVACGGADALFRNGNTDAARASGFRTHIGICNGMEAG